MIRIVIAILLGTSSLLAQSNSTSGAEGPSTKPAAPDSTKLVLIRGEKAKYPDAAKAKKLQGQVWLLLNISETGSVEDVEVLSGDPILAESAVQAAKTWVFQPFIRNGQPVKISHKFPVDFAFRQNVREVTPPTQASASPNEKSSTNSKPAESSGTGKEGAIGDGPRSEVPADVSKGYLLHAVSPVYPDHARQNRIQGKVLLRAIIDKSGRVTHVEAISGQKELIDAAIGAVQQWRYRPYIANGEPIEIQTEVTVNFTLAGN